MTRLHNQNIIVLCLGIGIAAVGAVFPDAGALLRHGMAIALGSLIALKGISPLPCKISDVLLAAAAFCLVTASKLVQPSMLSPRIFEVTTLILLLIYIITGLTYKSMIDNQRSQRGS